MLEWSADGITTTAIDVEFLPTVTNVERGVRNGVRAAADAYSTHVTHEL